MSSAVTGLNVCASRIEYNINASPAAQAKKRFQCFKKCEAFAIGWNVDIRRSMAVLTVMRSAHLGSA
jgi:hypothetical protein